MSEHDTIQEEATEDQNPSRDDVAIQKRVAFIEAAIDGWEWGGEIALSTSNSSLIANDRDSLIAAVAFGAQSFRLGRWRGGDDWKMHSVGVWTCSDGDAADRISHSVLPFSCLVVTGPHAHGLWYLSGPIPKNLYYAGFGPQYEAEPVPETGTFPIPGVQVQPLGGQLARAVAWRPHLRYAIGDVAVSAFASANLINLVTTPPDTADGMRRPNELRTDIQLSVVSQMKELGLSRHAIEAVLQYQPVGSSWGGLSPEQVGATSIVDQFCTAILAAVDGADPPFTYVWSGDKLWFSLRSAMEWWYPLRRADSLPVVPVEYMRQALIAVSRSNRLDLGYYVEDEAPIHRTGDTTCKMWGIDLEMATASGLRKTKRGGTP